jgi:hypothetical protein
MGCTYRSDCFPCLCVTYIVLIKLAIKIDFTLSVSIPIVCTWQAWLFSVSELGLFMFDKTGYKNRVRLMFVGTPLVPIEISVGATLDTGVNGLLPLTYKVAVAFVLNYCPKFMPGITDEICENISQDSHSPSRNLKEGPSDTARCCKRREHHWGETLRLHTFLYCRELGSEFSSVVTLGGGN